MNSNSIFEDSLKMVLLYNIGIFLLKSLYWIASSFNPKARSFLQGRRQQQSKLRQTFPLPPNEKLVWFHCASVGEFEQGRPVLEALKLWNPSLKILLTFFSPSGYELRKNYEHAEFMFYLPWDTKTNARWFAENVKPALVIFVKYEFWYHYARALRDQNIPLISISSFFRPDQIFFKSYGSFFQKILRNFNHFFVQNKESIVLLQTIGISEVTLAGDTRFDRVYHIMQRSENLPLAQQFKNGQTLMVIGSAWPEDVEVLLPFINENKGRIKFIIAPHEISEGFLTKIENSIEAKSIRYSIATDKNIGEASVLLIDNVGMLSRLYRYGEFAFVGGGFNQGLHNILEAACFGIPIFFGNRAYQKYQEAVDLVLRGGAFEVGDYMELKSKVENLNRQKENFALACEVTRQYVLENLGASDTIVAYCKKILG